MHFEKAASKKLSLKGFYVSADLGTFFIHNNFLKLLLHKMIQNLLITYIRKILLNMMLELHHQFMIENCPRCLNDFEADGLNNISLNGRSVLDFSQIWVVIMADEGVQFIIQWLESLVLELLHLSSLSTSLCKFILYHEVGILRFCVFRSFW